MVAIGYSDIWDFSLHQIDVFMASNKEIYYLKRKYDGLFYKIIILYVCCQYSIDSIIGENFRDYS